LSCDCGCGVPDADCPTSSDLACGGSTGCEADSYASSVDATRCARPVCGDGLQQGGEDCELDGGPVIGTCNLLVCIDEN
jgi:hypothetical protein